MYHLRNLSDQSSGALAPTLDSLLAAPAFDAEAFKRLAARDTYADVATPLRKRRNAIPRMAYKDACRCASDVCAIPVRMHS